MGSIQFQSINFLPPNSEMPIANFALVLLLSLNLPFPNLSTPPCQFILKKMETFRIGFDNDLKNFGNKISIPQNAGRNHLHLLGHAMMHAEYSVKYLPSKIEEMKKEEEKYLEEDGNYGEIAEKFDKWKFEGERMNSFKEHEKKLKIETEIERETAEKLKMGKKLKEKIEEEEGIKIERENVEIGQTSENRKEPQNEVENRLGLIQEWIELLERGNRFVDKVKVELQIRMPLDYILVLSGQMKREKEKMEKEFDEIFKKYEMEGFKKIAEIIEKKKEELRGEFGSLNLGENEKNMEEELKGNLKILKEAIYSEKPILEKVELKDIPLAKMRKGAEKTDRMYRILKMKQQNNAAFEIPKLIAADKFFRDNQKEYADLRNNLYTFQFLVSASSQMYNLVVPLVWSKLDKTKESRNLAYIHWLSQYIRRSLEKIYNPLDILSMGKLRELPGEWIIDGKNETGENVKKMAILIAENMLFISAKLEQIHNIEEAVEQQKEKETMGQSILNINKMVNEGIAPEQLGTYFYRKYEEKYKSTIKSKNTDEASSSKNELLAGKMTKLEVGQTAANIEED